jgi:hypothetical protein
MTAFSEAVHKVGGTEGVWGFVDSTFQGYCCPTGNEEQRRVYLGHKKLYGNNY